MSWVVAMQDDDDKLTDENGRLSALHRYDLSGTGQDKAFQRIVDLVQTVLNVPMSAVTLIDAERQWIKAGAGMAVGSGPREFAFCNETIKQRGPLAVTDATLDGRFAHNPGVTGAPHIRSYLGVPLTTPEGYNIGSLCAIDTEPRPFDARQAGILSTLAQIVVEQFELRQIARQDAMTGALTRRGLLAEVEKEFLRATRYDRPSALMVIDVDNFRVINDRHGHPAGDAVLVSIANACMSAMRKSDVFGRIGGEEFAMLLPETEADDARDAAERIRHIVESTIVETSSQLIRATVSIGIAPVPAGSEDALAWLSEADIALYEAKQFGRNRVAVVKPRRPTMPPAELARQAGHPN
ncbi:MAG TPA: sensor domain-containing diguanylate cyclase [Alphaproteobacteria bacterium]|jgi:diguanylate cyclase (GGDEF)-like protein|nr:sensor domain-containing diguanylate cyclase [Alphaproteobacteria bacterium]